MKSGKYTPQVDADVYGKERYLNVDRWSSYALVIKEVLKLRPKKVLEIGPGNGIVTNILLSLGIQAKTMDIDKKVDPDYIEDITSKNLKTFPEKFDLVIATEVLEHVEYKDALQAMSNLKHITDTLLLSLPRTRKGSAFFLLFLKFPLLPRIQLARKIHFKKEKHVFDGQHYWEIGKKGYSLRKLKKDIQKSGWYSKRDYINPDKPYHHFFVLVRNEHDRS